MLYQDLLEKIGFDSRQKQDYERYYACVGKITEPLAYAYMREGKSMGEVLEILRREESRDISKYTLDIMFALASTGYLYEDYLKSRVSEDVFINTMKDFKYKADECRNVKGLFGLSFVEWYDGFFRMTRFGLGRLEYDLAEFPYENTEICGYKLNKGDFTAKCHIPSAGPLKNELCLDSYKRAYSFFKDRIKDGILPITTHSWLLYPDYQRVFGEGSNIYRFASDFTVIKVNNTEDFPDGWRVFNKPYDEGGLSSLPQETRLQKSFMEYIKNGGSFGTAYGVILFDGERIVSK